MAEKFKNWAQKPVSIVLTASVLVLLSNLPTTYALKYGLFVENGPLHYLSQAVCGFFFMFIVPALAIKYIFHKSLGDFGLRLPVDWSKALKLSSAAVLIWLPLLFFLSRQASFKEYYAVRQGFGLFLLLSVGLGAIYYLAEEFLFRGFLFFGLLEKFKYHSFWVVNLLFVLFHIGKPSSEVLASFFLGLTLTFLTYKTKSIFPAMLTHLIWALVLNILVNL